MKEKISSLLGLLEVRAVLLKVISCDAVNDRAAIVFLSQTRLTDANAD